MEGYVWARGVRKGEARDINGVDVWWDGQGEEVGEEGEAETA